MFHVCVLDLCLSFRFRAIHLDSSYLSRFVVWTSFCIRSHAQEDMQQLESSMLKSDVMAFGMLEHVLQQCGLEM